MLRLLQKSSVQGPWLTAVEEVGENQSSVHLQLGGQYDFSVALVQETCSTPDKCWTGLADPVADFFVSAAVVGDGCGRDVWTSQRFLVDFSQWKWKEAGRWRWALVGRALLSCQSYGYAKEAGILSISVDDKLQFRLFVARKGAVIDKECFKSFSTVLVFAFNRLG